MKLRKQFPEEQMSYNGGISREEMYENLLTKLQHQLLNLQYQLDSSDKDRADLLEGLKRLHLAYEKLLRYADSQMPQSDFDEHDGIHRSVMLLINRMERGVK